MTQKEKQLLFQDLCARLPYGVKIYHIYSEKPVRFNSKHLNQIGGFKILPYLRPMSSMTIEERFEYNGLCNETADFNWEIISHQIYDWLNAHHFDYRGLIKKGWALPAPEGMYNENC